MDNDGSPNGTPQRDRPIQEQVAVLRHDMAGLVQKVDLMGEMIVRQTTRIERSEERQNVIEGQLALVPLTVEAFRKIVRDELQDIETNKVEREQAREEERWKKISRYTIFITVFAVFAPYVRELIGAWL